MYIYAREYEASLTNFLGFFQIRTGWLPFAQMAQDGAQTGDVMPNLIGLLSGHFYYYTHEVAPRLLLPKRPPTLSQFFKSMDKAEEEGAKAKAGGAEEKGAEEKEGLLEEAEAEAEVAEAETEVSEEVGGAVEVEGEGSGDEGEGTASEA